MSTKDYTLLLIESPTIANVLRRLDLPYVEVIATHGYCWKPVWKSDQQSLVPRANPDHVELRKHIKQQARWASRVVIATDSDPSGDFIAYALHRHLRSEREDVQRTYLQALTRSSVLKAMEQSEPYQPDQYRRLVHRMLIQRVLRIELSEIFDPLPARLIWTALALLNARNQELPLHTAAEQQPWSTLDALMESRSVRPKMSFSKLQQEWERLFTTPVLLAGSTQVRGLISYPRTASRGYYQDTWQHLQNQWIRHHALESFRPDPIQATEASAAPHQALHPLNLAATPQQVRPLLPRLQFQLYRLLYQHHQKIVRMPEPNATRDVQEATDALHRIMHQHALRPSNTGQALDDLIAHNWIQPNVDSRTDTFRFSWGSEAKRMASRIEHLVDPVIQKLTSFVSAESLSEKTVASVLEPLIRRL
jgi:DNA topoisomerase IA